MNNYLIKNYDLLNNDSIFDLLLLLKEMILTC